MTTPISFRFFMIALIFPLFMTGCLSEGGFTVNEELLKTPSEPTPPVEEEPEEPWVQYLNSPYFVTRWKTDNTIPAGAEDFTVTTTEGLNNRTIRLPLTETETYNLTVRWGDGQTSIVTNPTDKASFTFIKLLQPDAISNLVIVEKIR